MLLGVYSVYLSSISNLFLPVLVPMGIGLVLGCLIFMKLTKFLLNNFYAQTFFSIIGFSLGSILIILPQFSFDIMGGISFLCIILGVFIGRLFN